MTRREWIALAAAGTLAKAGVKESIIGEGWGLDHFIVVLADPASLNSIYRSKLGFTVIPGAQRPAGYENAVVNLGPAYVELICMRSGLGNVRSQEARIVNVLADDRRVKSGKDTNMAKK